MEALGRPGVSPNYPSYAPQKSLRFLSCLRHNLSEAPVRRLAGLVAVVRQAGRLRTRRTSNSCSLVWSLVALRWGCSCEELLRREGRL